MKKTISYILTVLMLILNLHFSVASAEETLLKTEETELLTALNLIEEEGFAEDDYLTRAEFCKVLCKLFDFEVSGQREVTFRDIDATHECFDAVSYLYSRGIIKGLSKYSFAPNRPITAQEAASIIVAALGFSEIAQVENASMFVKAGQLGVLDGISLSSNANITEEIAKKLMYNTLFAPIAKADISRKETVYTDDEALMMNEVYNLYEIKGIVTENATTSLFAEGKIEENQIRIDTEVYQNVMEDIDSLVGYSVYAYVMYDDVDEDEGTVIYAKQNAKYNNVYELDADDIISVNENYLSYETDKKDKKVEFASSMDTIYNGIGTKNFEKASLKPEYGTVKLIDNNGDNKIDVAFVTEYKSILVQSMVSSDTEFNIYDKYGNNIIVDLSKEDCVVNVWKNGKSADISGIVSGGAILVVDSGIRGNTRLINIYLHKETLSGVLKGIGDEQITLDNQTIEINPYFDRASASYYMSKKVNVYIDINGKASFVTMESNNQYGFLYKGIWEVPDDDLLLIVFTTDNELKRYVLSDKVMFNAEGKEDYEVYEELLDGNTEIEQQVIRFEVNDDGKITKLYTPQFRTKEDGSLDIDYDDELRDKGMFRKSMLLMQRQRVNVPSALYAKNGQGAWVEAFFSGTIPVLLRPEGKIESESEMRWETQSYFVMNHAYNCEGYDMTEDNVISVLVVYEDVEFKVKSTDGNVVVDKITTEVNEDNEVVQKLWGYSDGVLTDYEAANENSFMLDGEVVKHGDVVRLAKDPNNRVDHVDTKLRFRVTSPESFITNYDDQTGNTLDTHNPAYAACQIPVGKVVKVYGNYVRIEVKDSAQQPKYINLLLRSATKYTVYDGKQRSGHELKAGSKNDIAIGDYIVARLYYARLDEVAVFKLD